MQFTSMAFAVFALIVFLIYWAVPNKYRMPLLLMVSYGFYMTFSPGYVLLLVVLSLMTYAIGRKCTKVAVICGISAQVAVLMFFKYAGFIPAISNSIVIPVGISFYIFKAISYMVDVYQGKTEAEKKMMPVLLYLAFFPDIVSGPINRATILIPQLKEEKIFRYENAVYGMRLILLGVFKKLLIANTLARYVDQVFALYESYMGITYFFVMIFYTIQIYCDFSGYSDMAVGIARLFGITSMENFKAPYLAANIREFWSRWHITLSTWLKDYIYIPLGGSKRGKVKTYFNLMVTFLVSGIWHGANLTFVIWGALHGLYQVIHRFYRQHCKWKMPRIAGVIITFFSVSFAWLFFRAENVYDAIFMIRYMTYNLDPLLSYHKMGMVQRDFWMLILSIGMLGAYDIASLKKDMIAEMDHIRPALRWTIYLVAAAVIIAFHIHNGVSQQFIYFQF